MHALVHVEIFSASHEEAAPLSARASLNTRKAALKNSPFRDGSFARNLP